MDIFNKVPTIAEDTVVFSIYSQPGEDETSVLVLSALILAFVNDELVPNHLWHRDSFDIKVVENEDDKSVHRWIMEGTVRVGDCIDDEWCIVWLLMEISAKWDVVISVYDTDGEFLLIEAAEHLPNWVTPTNSDNRVWIYKSELHLIPLEHISKSQPFRTRRKRITFDYDDGDEISGGADTDSGDAFISVDDATMIVRRADVSTTASASIQSAFSRRIKSYPSALTKHAHLTNAYIPQDIFLALSQNPNLIQKAVEAFYTRDALQLRVATKMTRFPPGTSINVPVKMTRTSYAQLMGQRFHPPKVFGRWGEAEGTKEWRRKDIGMKIACGFEMLYSEGRSRVSVDTNGLIAMEAAHDSLTRDLKYRNYLDQLKRAGFFPGGEIEGSQAWKDHERKAARTWIEVHKTDDATRPSFASLVDTAIPKEQTTKDHLLNDIPHLIHEDPEEWLSAIPAEMESALTDAKEKLPSSSNDMEVNEPISKDFTSAYHEPAPADPTEKEAERLQNLAKKVEQFLEGKGSLEGALLDGDAPSDDEEDDQDLDLSDPPSEDDSEDEENPAKDKQKALDALVAPLDPEDYGKLPLVKEGSQRAPSQKTTRITMENETRTMPSGEQRPIRKPILMRDKFDGVDSDDESDETDEDDTERAVRQNMEEDESDDEKPTVVGGVSMDLDIDMAEEEEEFLKFAREALGLSDNMWDDIVRDRTNRGAFVPGFAQANNANDSSTNSQPNSNTTRQPTGSSSNIPKPDHADGIPPPRNLDLNSFESVMKAMDDELQKTRDARKAARASTKPSTSAKGKEKENVASLEEKDEDIEAAMDAELQSALNAGEPDENEELADAGMDYNLIKNFLESFRNQGGQSGPVSNLAGRLDPGWNLPRDES